MSSSPADVVRQFCAAVGAGDFDRCRTLLDDAVVYHNIPMDPIEGLPATMEAVQGMVGAFSPIEFRIRAIAAEGGTVLTERVDNLTAGGTTVSLPVMGAFEVRDGRITAWRDYFDLGQASQLMGGG